MIKKGIVFSGGGGRGAYAIGVWKALRKYGLDQDIKAVSGTSVGGLNGALFVQGDLEVAEQLWLDIARDKILQLDIQQLAEKLARIAATMAIPGFQAKAIIQAANLLKGKGWFSQDGLEKLILESGACQSIANSQLPFYVCALGQKDWQLNYPHLNTVSEQEIGQWLLASAAIPGIFSPVTINDENYWDGGVLPGNLSNNTPFQPLIEKHQCTHIINIYLSRSPDVANAQRDYPNTRFWNIIPSEQIDTAISALNFTAENAKKLIELGYQDADKMLARFKQFMDDEERYLDAITDFQSGHQVFQDQVQLNESLRTSDPEDAPPVDYKTIMDQLAVSIEQQERQLIDSGIDQLVDEMKDNSDALLEDAFTAVTTLASTEGRINGQLDQGTIGRLISTVTGSHISQQAEINRDFHASLYATQSLVQKLNQKQMLTMEAMVSLSNKSNYLMSHINMLYGAVKSSEQRYVDTFKSFSKGIESLALETEQRFSGLEQRVEQIEHKQALDDWFHEVRTLNLSRPAMERLVYTTASFYIASDRQWSQPAINRYKSVLQDQGLADSCFNPAELFSKPVAQRFIEPLPVQDILPVAPEKAQYHQLLKGIQRAVEDQPVEQLQAVPPNIEMTGQQLGMELLYSLRRNDRKRSLHNSRHKKLSSAMPSAEQPLQTRYLNTLQQLEALGEKLPLSDSLLKNIVFLKDKISQFKVVVPVVGKFSAGKSALINRFLGTNHLASDITPETAIATELAWDANEHIILNYQDGQTERRKIEELNSLTIHDRLAYIQVFLNNPRLKHRPDLVLVDMPGFDSKNDSHHKAIAWYLERGDYFISLMPSDVPFDASVMEHLQEIHWDYQKQIACLISKASRRSPTQLKELQAELESSLFNYLQQTIKPGMIEALDSDGSIQAFEDELDKAVNAFEPLLAARYQNDIERCLKQAEQILRTEQQHLNAGEEEIRQQIAEAEKSFRQVRQTFDQQISELRYNLCSEGKEQLINDARSALNGATGQLVRAAKTNALGQELNTLLRPVLQIGLHDLINREVEHLQTSLEQMPQAEGLLNIPPVQLPPEDKEQFSIKTASIAAAVAMAFTGPVGVLVTGLVGGLLGRKDNAAEREQQIEQQVSQQVIPEALNQTAQLLDTQLHEAITRLTQSIQQTLAQEEASYQDNLGQLKEIHKQAEAEKDTLLKTYGESLQKLSELTEIIALSSQKSDQFPDQ